MLIEGFGDCICEIVRRIVANIDRMSGAHHGGDGALQAAQQGQRRCCAHIAALPGQLCQQRLWKLEENELVKLAAPPPFALRRSSVMP